MFEAFTFGDVVDEESGYGASVVGARDRAEIFLPGGVPDLKFKHFVIECKRFGAKFDSNC